MSIGVQPGTGLYVGLSLGRLAFRIVTGPATTAPKTIRTGF